jgi:hypothetical protein
MPPLPTTRALTTTRRPKAPGSRFTSKRRGVSTDRVDDAYAICVILLFVKDQHVVVRGAVDARSFAQ